MTLLFTAPDRLQAWRRATEYLAKSGDQLNVILDVLDPTAEGVTSSEAYRLLDELYRQEGEYSVHTVAETIFPGWEYAHRGLSGVFQRYPQEYVSFKRGDSSWGRYAYRLVRREGRDGRLVNPLEVLIRKMRRARRAGQTGFRACYEIGIADGVDEISLYDTVQDSGRLRGAPCLTHVSFKLIGQQVHLTALYRSHDYRYKVPGNLLGLARLQACVASEVGGRVGTLVVHSTLAYLGQGGGKARIVRLLKELHGAEEGRSLGS